MLKKHAMPEEYWSTQKVAKAGTEVNEGDIIEIRYASGSLKAKIVNISEHVLKDNAKDMYEIIS